MQLPNRDGVAVDPVPFVVITGLAALLMLSFGPLYGQALGLSLSTAIAGSVCLSVLATVSAYYQQVWTARPDMVGELPAGARGERLFYLMAILAVVIVALSIPLVI